MAVRYALRVIFCTVVNGWWAKSTSSLVAYSYLQLSQFRWWSIQRRLPPLVIFSPRKTSTQSIVTRYTPKPLSAFDWETSQMVKSFSSEYYLILPQRKSIETAKLEIFEHVFLHEKFSLINLGKRSNQLLLVKPLFSKTLSRIWKCDSTAAELGFWNVGRFNTKISLTTVDDDYYCSPSNAPSLEGNEFKSTLCEAEITSLVCSGRQAVHLCVLWGRLWRRSLFTYTNYREGTALKNDHSSRKAAL